MKSVHTILDTVGKTPLVRLNRLSNELGCDILAKLESFNPCSSVKDRIALNMIDQAERDGLLKPGMSVIEATSGNTGIGLAMVCAARGYPLVLTMPETMSMERRRILNALGACLELSPGPQGMNGAIAVAGQMMEREPDRWFMPRQFDNPANPAVHYLTTGPEIWQESDGNIDVFVAGIGTGGTFTGTTRFLREKNPDLLAIALEPASSAVLSGEPPGPHGIQGIGAGFIPRILDVELIDDVVTIRDEDALKMAQRLAREEGIFAGISSGAAVWGTCSIAARPEYAGKRFVTVLPDCGDRYLSIMKFTDQEED